MKIPIATYTGAMRIAVKYSMDDVQHAIVRVITSLPSDSGIGKAIARLAFTAEFSGHFYKPFFKEVFVQACSTVHRPSGLDLTPLMVFPNLVALMMEYREGIIQSKWNERTPSPASPVRMWGAPSPRGRALSIRSASPVGRVSGEDNSLDKQLESLGLAPFAI